MTTSTASRTILWGVCLWSCVSLAIMVAAGHGQLLALTFYGIALGSSLLALGIGTTAKNFLQLAVRAVGQPVRQRLLLPIAAVAVQMAALAYFSAHRFHHVQDEFITAYTSLTLPSLREIHWFAGYPDPGEWLARFPILFHILQQPFFALLGPSVEMLRVSTWPYHLLTAICLYALASEIFADRRWGAATVVTFAVLAPNLYLGGLGLHFISSTAFFTAAFTCFVLTLTRESRGFALLCGLFTVMAYLSYLSSYLTLPLLLAFAAFIAIRRRSTRPIQLLIPALIVFVIGILPFAVHAVAQENYFTDRTEQIAATRSEDVTVDATGHVLENIQSLYRGGIGGVNDYWFGLRPLFDPLTLSLTLLGTAVAISRGLRHRETFWLCAAAILGATFALGMLLTAPAGAFHRTSLAFPFVALLIMLAIRTISMTATGAIRHPMTGAVVPLLLVTVIAIVNLATGVSMVRDDAEIRPLDSIHIARYLEEQIPEGSRVLIAAFPNYHLERELTFRNRNAFTFETREFEETLQMARQEPVILLDPLGWKIDALQARFPNGQIVHRPGGRDLERHAIFIPQPS